MLLNTIFQNRLFVENMKKATNIFAERHSLTVVGTQAAIHAIFSTSARTCISETNGNF